MNHAVPQNPAVPVMSSTSCAESKSFEDFGAELRHLQDAAAVDDLLARETLQALILGVASYSAAATLMWSPVPTPQNGGPQFEGPSFCALLGGAVMELGKLLLKRHKAPEFPSGTTQSAQKGSPR